MKSEPTFSLYILLCGDGLYYTGISTKPNERLASHQLQSDFQPNRRQWTKFHQPVQLVFQYNCIENQSIAIRMERYVKSLKKEYKKRLVAGDPVSFDYLKKKHQFFVSQTNKAVAPSYKFPISNRP